MIERKCLALTLEAVDNRLDGFLRFGWTVPSLVEFKKIVIHSLYMVNNL
jgi:hypothetical protein